MSGKAKKGVPFPIIVEKDEDGSYVVECPVLEGCYSQGKTLDEAMKNIREAIGICLEEQKTKEFLKSYRPVEFSFHTITIGA
jgi:predicted RNase H-like HicB family nuclease